MKTSHNARQGSLSTDAELANKVRSSLRANRFGFEHLKVGAEGGTVTLTGSIRSYFLRQLAGELAKHVTGVRHVVDELEVDQREIGTR